MSSGVAWIDRQVTELAGAREYLATIGLPPRPWGGDRHAFDRAGRPVRCAISEGWRVAHWQGVFTDDMLIDFAKERGFRP
jgi:hypothetical protein